MEKIKIEIKAADINVLNKAFIDLLSVMERDLQMFMCIECVESVLPIWESRYPSDNIPRRAIEAVKFEADSKKLRAAASLAYAAAGSAAHVVAPAAAAAFAADATRQKHELEEKLISILNKYASLYY